MLTYSFCSIQNENKSNIENFLSFQVHDLLKMSSSCYVKENCSGPAAADMRRERNLSNSNTPIHLHMFVPLPSRFSAQPFPTRFQMSFLLIPHTLITHRRIFRPHQQFDTEQLLLGRSDDTVLRDHFKDKLTLYVITAIWYL